MSEIKNKLIIELGSGAGRFTEILLSAGCYVISVEMSDAIYVNSSNNKSILLYICLDIWFKQTDTKPILHLRWWCNPVDKQARSKDWFNSYLSSDAISANELINEYVYMIWHW